MLSTQRLSLRPRTKSMTYLWFLKMHKFDKSEHARSPARPTPPRQCKSTWPLCWRRCSQMGSTTSRCHFWMSEGGAISIMGYFTNFMSFLAHADSYCLTFVPIQRISTSLRRQIIIEMPFSLYYETSILTSRAYFLPSLPIAIFFPGQQEMPKRL